MNENINFIERLVREKSINARKILAKIYRDGYVEEEEAVKIVNINKDNVRKLLDNSFLLSCFSKKGQKIYVLEPRFLAENSEKCKSCSQSEKVVVKKDKKVRLFRCQNSECFLYNMNKCASATKLLVANGFEKYEKKVIKRGKDTFKEKDIKEWGKKDFDKFFRVKYSEIIKSQLAPERRSSEKYVFKFVSAIYESIKNKEIANLMMKKYIVEHLNERALKGGNVSLKVMFSSRAVKGILQKGFPRKCEMHKIYCSFWEGRCMLEEMGNRCTFNLRSRMIGKYTE